MNFDDIASVVEAIGSGGHLNAATFVAACMLIVTATAAPAATEPTATKILTCKDANGKPLATDKSDPRCFTPPPTPDQKAAQEEQKRKEQEAYNACKAEQRSLQGLLSRYPDKAKHDEARRAALSQVEAAIGISEGRLAHLQAERKRLADEAEFYPSGNLPPKLRRDIDANMAVIAAQTLAIANQKAEAAQKNAFYDDELAKLKKLWLAKGIDSRPCVAPRD